MSKVEVLTWSGIVGDENTVFTPSKKLMNKLGELLDINKIHYYEDDEDYASDEEFSGGDFRTFGEFTFSSDDGKIGSFCLAGFEGNCGIVILTQLSVAWAYQNKGVSEILIKQAIKFAKRAGYGAIIGTTVMKVKDDHMNKSLKNMGYMPVFNFINPRTDNGINVWMEEL